MTQGSRYSDQQKRWWKESLGENLVDSRTILPREGHNRIRVLAEQLGERIPILLGKFVMASLSMFDKGTMEPPRIDASGETFSASPNRTETPVLLDSDIFDLCFAIVSSRFPEDNGAIRMRQAALVMTVARETAAGRKPTTSSIGRITGNRPSQMILLAKPLEDRGVLTRTRMSAVNSGKSAKVLRVRPDALEALEAAHVSATGQPIPRTDPDTVEEA